MAALSWQRQDSRIQNPARKEGNCGASAKRRVLAVGILFPLPGHRHSCRLPAWSKIMKTIWTRSAALPAHDRCRTTNRRANLRRYVAVIVRICDGSRPRARNGRPANRGTGLSVFSFVWMAWMFLPMSPDSQRCLAIQLSARYWPQCGGQSRSWCNERTACRAP